MRWSGNLYAKEGVISMSTKSILIAVLLVSVGIVFGVVLVSGLKGVGVTFADQDVVLGLQSQPVQPHASLRAMNEAFQQIAKGITPSVVYITVVTRAPKEDEGGQFFHRFFGPDIRPRQGPEFGAGSGVILTADGYILT